MRWAGRLVCTESGRGAYRVLVGIPEEKRPLGRPRLRQEDNIKMYEEIEWRRSVDTIDLVQELL
jgi:hypothetical protein